MFKPHTKFKVSKITSNGEMKGNAKCKKILILSNPLGKLRVTHGVYLAYCRLSISNNSTFLASSHGCGTIKRNLSKSAFSEGVGHFERNFLVDGDVARNSSMDR